MKDFSQVFSDRMKQIRGDRSKSAFGRFLGIKNPSTYHNYEAGRLPDSHTVKMIAEKTGVSVDWLLGRTENHSSPLSSCSKPGEPSTSISVRDPSVGYCQFPADACNLPKEIADLRSRLDAQSDQISDMADQIKTVVNLLGVALGRGLHKQPSRHQAG